MAMLEVMSETPRPVITADLAVLGFTAVSAAGQREEHITPVVVDTNAVIQDVLWNSVPRPRASALVLALAVGSIRLLGKRDLIEEVVERLPEAAGDRPIAPLLAILAEQYLPHLRLVDVGGISLPTAEETIAGVAKADPDDEPTARLTRLLDPSILLTADKDLLNQHFGEWYEPGGRLSSWTAAAFTLYDRSAETQMTSVLKGSAMLGVLPTYATAELVRAGWRHPRLAAGMVAAAGVGAWAARRSTRWAAIWHSLRAASAQVVAQTAKYAQSSRLPEAMEAKRQLADYCKAHPGLGTPEAVLARHLAIAPKAGLSAAELYAITSRAATPSLKAYPAFVADQQGRWHLGQPASLPE
jgi:hypothetical protein